jgi:hypothetical protein
VGAIITTLPDGSQWVFKFVKIACNVDCPVGQEENQNNRIDSLPLNPDYDPIPLSPHEGQEMMVVGE